MATISILPFLLIIFGILIGVAGLTFLILGLVQNKKVFWISGTAGIVVAVILFAIGIITFVRPFVNNIANGIEKFDLKNRHFNNLFSNMSEYNNNPVDTTYADAISGFVEDTDNSPVFIRVFPKRDLLSLGTIVESVGKGENQNDSPKSVTLTIRFDNAFNGTMILIAYNGENIELGSSELQIDKESGETSHINFVFYNEINFSDIRFCTLNYQ